jgi:hypothetical protein
MLPADPSFSYRSEIDIAEILGDDPQSVFMTYHYNNRSQSFSADGGLRNNGACTVKDYSADWVTLGLDWEPTYIAWYINGVKCGQFNGDATTIESGPMQLILHMMVGNDWQRSWNKDLLDSTLTRQLEVDYIHVWQQVPSGTPPPPAAPTVSISASPTSITAGQSSTLTWSSTNATSCTASNGWTGSKGASGSTPVSPTVTTTYTLTCTGAGGTTPAQSVTVTVTAAPPPPTGTCPATKRTVTATDVANNTNSGYPAGTQLYVPDGPDPWGGCFPGPKTTGIPAGTQLTAYTGPAIIDVPGTVIDGKIINVQLNIRAANVTIKNSKYIAGSLYVDSGSLMFTDSEADFTSNIISDGIKGSNLTVLHSNLYGGRREFYCNSNCTLQDSYLHDQLADPTGAAHESAARVEQYTTLKHNTLNCNAPLIPPDAGCSANQTGYPDFVPIHHNTLDKNLYMATTGGFCSYLGASAGKPYSSDPTNASYVVSTNNVFQRGTSPNDRPTISLTDKRRYTCGVYGVVTDYDVTKPGVTICGNMWDDGLLFKDDSGYPFWPLPNTCGGATTAPPPASTKFTLNDRVQVTNATLNVRATPDIGGTLLGSQTNGALGTVVGGPIAQAGYSWWQINYDTGVDGWSVEDYLAKYTAPPPPPAAPTVTISASPSSIISGQSSTLTWSSVNATSCTASNGWIGTKATSGTQNVSPTANITYTLLCQGTGGSATQSTTVTVTAPPPPVSTKFSLNDRVQVTNGPLNVRSTANTTGTQLGTQATGALGTVVGGPTAQGGFNWWQINYDSGADGWSVETYLTKYTAPPAALPTVTLSASPTSITSGQSSKLTWSSTSATSCTGTGFTAANISGSVNVSPTTNTTYSIVCNGAGGSANATASVAVTAAPVGTPDLVVTSVTSSPANPTTGQLVTFSAIVKNQGSAATPAGTIVGVLFNLEGTFTWSDTNTTSLAPGASVTLTANGGANGSTWSAVLGAHTVTATVDDVNRIPESNESNNTLSSSVTVTVPTQTLGITNIGPNTDDSDANNLTATRITTGSVGGAAQSMSAYVASPISSAPNNQYSMAIYSDVGGLPGSLVAKTSNSTLTGNAWNTLPISATLAPNTTYWLVYTTNGAASTNNNLRYGAGSSGQMQWHTQTFGTWPTSFGTSNGNNAVAASIYVTYTPSSGVSTPTPPPAAPTASLSASQTSINSGQSTTLTWSSSNTTSCTGSGFTPSGTTGSTSVSPTSNTTYSISCTGAGGTANRSVSVTVTIPAPTASLSASPSSITRGQSTTLTWSSTNATSCSGTNFSPSGTSGSTSVSPTSNTTYTVTCSGAGGSANQSTSVTVTMPPQTLGNTSIAGSADDSDANNINAIRFTTGSLGGAAQSMSVYIASPISAAPNNLYSMAIYSDSSGMPGSLLAQTSNSTLTGNAWNTLPISLTLASNTVYWLAYNTNAAASTDNNLRYGAGSTGQWQWRPQTFGMWPASFGGLPSGGTSATTASIYVTYTPSSAYFDNSNVASPIYAYPINIAPPVSKTMAIGGIAHTTSNLNVRLTPNGQLVGTEKSGVTGVVSDGPVVAAGYTWWMVEYADGKSGWSIENYLSR